MTSYSPQWKEKTVQPFFGSHDIEYFQGMYPQRIKELQKYVIRHCDTMDYSGSPIYDEYPDPLMLDQACSVICQQLPPNLKEETGESSQTQEWLEDEKVEAYEAGSPRIEAMQWGNPGGNRPPGGPPPWGPPGGPPPGGRPPGGPPPGGPPPWGPPPGGRPPGGPPPWGPPPGGRPPWGPPSWGPPPGGPPPWGPPPGGPPSGGSLISDVVKVLLMNELQRRRCRTGMC